MGMQGRNGSQPQELIVLAGVVGSGKSTLSTAWQHHLPDWVRVNQDDLGDRRTCEAAVRTALSQGMNVVVDRQNFDAGQRRTWLEIANEFPAVRVGGMVMGTPKEECRRRLLARTEHPTIDNPELALSLLAKFSGLWEEPRIDEGFDQLVTLPPLPPADEIDADLIRSLLDLLHRSPTNPRAAAQRTPRARPSQYARSDGFVDDGTWRPPPPSSGPFHRQPPPPPPHLYPKQARADPPSSSYGTPYGSFGYQPPQASMPAWTQSPPAYGGHQRGPYAPPPPPSGPTAWPNQVASDAAATPRTGAWRNESVPSSQNMAQSGPGGPYSSNQAAADRSRPGPPLGAGPPAPSSSAPPSSQQ